MRKLSDDELEVLQRLIVNEGWMPVSEHFSLHIYESRWDIGGIKYIIYKPFRVDFVEGWEVE